MPKKVVTEEHEKIVREIIDEIVNGEISRVRATEIINEKATSIGIATISVSTVQKIIEKQLEGDPEKLKKYKQALRANIGKTKTSTKSDGKSTDENRQVKVRRRKITKKHIEIATSLIDKMLTGEINIKEATAIINEEAKKEGLANIGPDSVQSIIEEALSDDPKKLAKYKEQRKHNSGKRSPVTLSEEKKKEILSEIPNILSNTMQVSDVAKKYNAGERVTKAFIEEIIKSRGEVAFEEYKNVISADDCNADEERREETKLKREDILSVKIAKKQDFLEMSIQEQREQVLYKYLQWKINRKDNTVSKLATEKKINELLRYFEEISDEKGNSYFSERDILYMIYDVESMIDYSVNEKIKPIVNYLESKVGINNMSKIVKDLPSVFGYDLNRVKKQVELLEDNKIIDIMIENPKKGLMSLDVVYALIEYAKERTGNTTLESIDLNDLFITNFLLKKQYNLSYDDLKERYPLPEKYQFRTTIDESLVGSLLYGDRRIGNEQDAQKAIEGSKSKTTNKKKNETKEDDNGKNDKSDKSNIMPEENEDTKRSINTNE